jgi:long-chain fatty acid transport protein
MFRTKLLLVASTSAALATLLSPSLAHAGGFYVPEVGARSTSMGAAVTAQSEDASMLFHNPAGLAGQKGTQIQINALGVLPKFEHWRRPVEVPDGAGSQTINFDKVQNTNKFGVVPSLFVTSDFGVDNLAVGLGLYIPFGAHAVFPEDGSQRYIVTEADLRNYYVTPTVAYKAWNRLSFGAGISYVYSSLDMAQANNAALVLGEPESNKYIDPESPLEGMNHLSATDKASFSANLGVTYTDPDDRFAFGVSVMLPTKVNFEGTAHIESPAILALDEEYGENLIEGERNDNFSVDFNLPMILRAGMMARPHDQVMVSLDVNWSRWSTSKELYIDFEDNPQLQLLPGATLYDVVIPQNWKDTLSVRAGVEGKPSANLPLFLRAGALYDESPIDDRYFDMFVPESDKWGISAGGGYQIDIAGKVRLDIDLSYMHLFFRERNIGPTTLGPDTNNGDDNMGTDGTLDDTGPNNSQGEIPGSDKTLLNKPAASYHYGVTRAAIDLLGLTIGIRI